MDKIYGQLNELRESIMNKVFTNQDLLKFIYYCDLVEINQILETLGKPKATTIDKIDILSLPNLTRQQRESLKNTQIFKYKRMPLNEQSSDKCFLSMQFTQIYRHKDNYWLMPCFEFIVVCPDSIAEVANGNRMLAIESCIADTFDMKDIGATGFVKVGVSETGNVDTGYASRKIPIRFIDWIERNE